MLEFEEYKGKLNGLKPTLVDLGKALKLEETEAEIAAEEALFEQFQPTPIPVGPGN